jgi:flavorubredoxin
MHHNEIMEDIFWVGVNDHDTTLFESIWPIPTGISYNSYLILDEKIALLDTVKETFFLDYLDKIQALLDGKHVDYLIVHHLEPDHSGSIKILQDLWPDIKIIGNTKTAEFLKYMFGIENIHVVGDGEAISLGRRTLQFHLTPMVHWPETMMTWCPENQILFSGDAFGSFGAIDGAVFDGQIDLDAYEDEILRYFSNIVGKYSGMVQKAFAKLKDLDIKIIAATHGPVWKDDPGYVISRYDRWSRHEPQPGVVLAWASMYGNTEKMSEVVAEGIRSTGLKKIVIHDVSKVHPSYIVRDIWRYKAAAFGAPAYDAGLFPPMANLLRLLEGKRIQKRIVGIFGTYGWSGGGVKGIREFAESLKLEIVEPVVEARFSPDGDFLNQCYELGRNIGLKAQR